jgi:YHS domain-containing protein
MKHYARSLAAAGLLCLGLIAAAPPGPSTQESTEKTPVNKKCPLTQEDVDKKVTVDYKGKTIGFCCEDCIAKFNKDPEKYMKDLK